MTIEVLRGGGRSPRARLRKSPRFVFRPTSHAPPLPLSVLVSCPSTLQSRAARAGRSSVKVQALSDANLVISAANAGMLALGRFVFLPYQRRKVGQAGSPKQNGKTYIDAGDRLAAEAAFISKTNDPAGFGLVDVMGWGALGHAVGFALLAIASNGYNGPFGN